MVAIVALTGFFALTSCTDTTAEDSNLYENEQAVDYTNVKRP